MVLPQKSHTQEKKTKKKIRNEIFSNKTEEEYDEEFFIHTTISTTTPYDESNFYQT